MEMTITRALAELKLLDKRIQRATNEGLFAGYVTGKTPMTGFQSVDEINTKVKADYQSVVDLIKRRNNIKSAIVISNANTDVTVAGSTMKVAEAIERKTAIQYEKDLLNKLRQTFVKITNHVDNVNEEVKHRLDKHLETLYGKEGKVRAGENEELIRPFLNENQAVFIDPINIKTKIDELTKQIDEFDMEIDYVLSESNTVQKITIED